MRVGKGKEECVVVATSAATHHAWHFFPANRIHKYIIQICTVRQILVARSLSLVRRHREEQLLDAAIVPVAGSFLSSSAVVASWVTNGELKLCFGINLPNKGDMLGTLRRLRTSHYKKN
jgi:hypothetical protein